MQRLQRAVENTRKWAQNWYVKREQQQKLSNLHDWSHVYSVARHAHIFAEEIARKQGLTQPQITKLGALAEATGYLHDVIRGATERVPHGPLGAKAVKKIYAIHKQLSDPPYQRNGLEKFTEKEINLIAKLTEIHEGNFSEVEKEAGKLGQHAQIVGQALVLGDDLIEASGFRVLERRAFFYQKKRLKDLAHLQNKYGQKTPLYAFAMESLLRLRHINELGTYPKYIRPVAEPLHQVQEEFFHGLLKHLEIESEEALLEEMKHANFPKAKELEKNIRKNIPKNNAITISKTSNDVAKSAAELVSHFVACESPTIAIETFKPKGSKAKEWLAGILNYHETGGEYLEEFRQKIRRAFANSKT